MRKLVDYRLANAGVGSWLRADSAAIGRDAVGKDTANSDAAEDAACLEIGIIPYD